MESLLGLTLGVERRQVSLLKICEFAGNLAFGDYFPADDVDTDVIGHWVEVRGRFDQVLYRRFIHNKFPLFPAQQVHKGRSNIRTQVQIELPLLPQASYVSIYEQSYRSTDDTHPIRAEVLHVELNKPLAQVG